MAEHWYKEAVVYCLDVDTFQDSNGDGVGDFRGLTSRLDYIDRLGATCIWLNPIHPSPRRDDGYDVTDYYAVDPRLGTLGDFADFLHEADNRGLRVIIDLVVNHTSDQHPWFQSARSDPESPYRDWYVWSKTEPTDRRQGMVFPGEQKETWTYDRKAKAWYFHRFYDFQPDLNIANPEVRAEILRIIGFWLRLGVSGFRMDAAPFVIEHTRADEPEGERDYGVLQSVHERLSWRRGDGVILAEANVPRDELVEYFGEGDRIPMLFNFLLNERTFLALARQDAAPLAAALEATPTIPPTCQWATFLRNHDEVDLSNLSPREREDVFAAFGPDPSMQLYGRGIRRRLATMLGGDERRIRMAYALQCTLPGTPVIRYGEEIGMGEDLSLPDRAAIRTPMQWVDGPNGGFSTAKPDQLVRPMVSGDRGPAAVNVVEQRRDPRSLLSWMERMLRTLRECPEFGTGTTTAVDTGTASVLALRHEAPTGVMLAITNVADGDCEVDLSAAVEDGGAQQWEVFSDGPYEPPPRDLAAVPIRGYGYRWIRLR